MRMTLCVAAIVLMLLSVSGCGGGSASAQSNPAVIDEALAGAGSLFHLTKLGSGLHVFMSDVGTGYEPWVTDGTTAGTFQLAETSSGDTGMFGYHMGLSTAFLVRGGEAYFLTYPGDVWRTDGTIAGTFKAVDLSPDGYEFDARAMSLDGNELTVGGCLFTVPDGSPGDCKVVTIDLG